MSAPLRLRVDRTWDGLPLAPGERAEVTLAADAGGGLRLTVDATYHADPPPAAPPGPTPRLWEHEAVELFVAGPGGDDVVEYLEVELGPHGHHLVLRLRGVRWVVESGRPLRYRAVVGDDGRWRGEALLPRGWLPAGPHRAALFAVHGVGRGRRWLASVGLGERRGEADFHRPGCFAGVVLP